MSPRRAILAAAAAFIAVNLLFLGARPVLTADETRYGSIAAQMVERGEWLALQMSGFKFYEKPPLVTWMMAASIEVFGHTGFAIRLPMALCGGLAALAAAVGARRGAMLAGRSRDEATVTGALVALCALTMVLPAVGATSRSSTCRSRRSRCPRRSRSSWRPPDRRGAPGWDGWPSRA